MSFYLNKYLCKVLSSHLSIYISPADTVLEINPLSPDLLKVFSGAKSYWYNSPIPTWALKLPQNLTKKQLSRLQPKHIVLNTNLHYNPDIQDLLEWVHSIAQRNTRISLVFSSALWRPFLSFIRRLDFASFSKLRPLNWISPEDLDNLLLITNFESVKTEKKILIPFWIPFLSYLVNRYLAPLPLLRNFCLLNIVIARPLMPSKVKKDSVSIIVPARNEAGNIEEIIQRIPKMGPQDELIFIEGGSKDNTWQVIRSLAKKYSNKKNIRYAQQSGRGKGDAVRKGFAMAKGDVLMILDADLTVPPEELPRFYDLIRRNAGEFINGSRLVYPMENEAMRFFNVIGNKFFALMFSFLLGQRFKDTLCGTKVIRKEHYKEIALRRSYFGKSDPFGDFDLLLGASRMNLKIIELPIHYKQRRYGTTNIARWRHGVILLRMFLLAARKIKFV